MGGNEMNKRITKLWIGLACGALFAAPAFAQRGRDVFRARIVPGGGDRDRCIAEVDVDSSAEVEIRGDEGRLRTTGGSEATWRRLECTAPLPPNPREFRFSGVDGRGSQVLLRAPGDNRGAAVVRIDDPKGGREGYTFRIEWRGSDRFDGGPGPGPGPGTGWNDQIDFRGRGDGYFRNFRGSDQLLRDCQVSVSRRGEVRVTFQTNRREQLVLNGRLVRSERDRLVADMSGFGIDGSMEIRLNGRDRVTDITMSGRGRDRFELRWSR
jgi:hypothetical protein